MTQQTVLFTPIDTSRKAARHAALAAATRRAELGMSRAELAVERLHPGWCVLAVDAVRKFARVQEGRFIVEQIRLAIEEQGLLPRPPEARVWGVITRRAAEAGYIAPSFRDKEQRERHMMPAASSNGTLKPAWKRGSAA